MKAKPNIIKTNRLILKDISLIDQEAFIDIICNEEVSLTYMVPIFKDKQEIINLFNRFIKLSNDENRFVYGIYLNNKLIGLINDVQINNDEIELGYVISPTYKNNGYATEALSNCINTLFDIGYKVVKTGAFKENKASIKVMEKCNMIKTNIIDKITYKGIEHECVNYEMRYNININKLNKFIENAKLINNHFNFICLLYGSLGLSTLIKQDIKVDDIDILIPEIYIKEKWDEFYNLLINNGYKLIDLHEHTFIKDDIKYSYASIENLKEFADINLSDIIDNGIYKMLSLDQYLKVYSSSIKDSYRIINKNKNDLEKIRIIKDNL